MSSLQDAIADASASRSPELPAPGPGTGKAAGKPFPDEGSGRLYTVLIAALGGEGGGVLSSWLVDAAAADGRTVQATSVPGVAQRTGATTYYLEIGPRATADAGGNSSQTETAPRARESVGAGSPVMALLPTPGNVDLLIASELLEAGRAAERGMITPERTTVIASTHRTFAIGEKSAMGDGRFDDERVQRAVRELARAHVLEDLGSVAERAGTVLSSVLLGAAAGSGALPIPREQVRLPLKGQGSRWTQVSGGSMPQSGCSKGKMTKRQARLWQQESRRKPKPKATGALPYACRLPFPPALMRFPVRSGRRSGWDWRERWISRMRATAGCTWIGSSDCSAR